MIADWRWLAAFFIQLSLLIRSHIVTITTLECVLIHSVIFFFYIPNNRAVALGGFRRFQTSTDFKTQKLFEKFYYKCIYLCNFICLNFSFNISDSCKILIPPMQTLCIIKISLILAQRCERKFILNFKPLSRYYDAAALRKQIVASF